MSWKAVISALFAAGVITGIAVPAGASNQGATSTTAPVSVAADRATAQAINLTAADLPGWKESPNPPNASDSSFNAELARCAGNATFSANDTVVDVTSANFDQGPIELSSDATMVRTRADGLADLKSVTDPKLLGCVTKVTKQEFAKQFPPGVKLSKLKVSLFTPSEPIPHSFGLHLSFTITLRKDGVTKQQSFAGSQINFLVGRAEVGLSEFETGKGSPVAMEAALLRTLDARAKSATGAQS